MTDRASVVPRFARGVRFRRLDDGAGVLLVPEGVINLSESAAAIAEAVDGARTAGEIGALLAREFDAPAATIGADVDSLLRDLADKTWLDFVERPER